MQNLVYSDKFQDRKKSSQLSITLVSFQDTKGDFILYAPQFEPLLHHLSSVALCPFLRFWLL